MNDVFERCGSTLRSLDLGFHMMDLTGLQLLENGLPELRKLNLRSVLYWVILKTCMCWILQFLKIVFDRLVLNKFKI